MPHRLFERAGSLRSDYEAVDWAATPLGDPSTWPSALLNVFDVVLSTRFPAVLRWGDGLTQLYNEAYVPLIQHLHPGALGASARDVYPDAWPVVGPMMEGVLAGQGATWVEDVPVHLRRDGFLERCWFTFSYSPVTSPDGEVLAVLAVATETTAAVLTGSRLGLVSRLGLALADLDEADAVCERACEVLQAEDSTLSSVELLTGDGAVPGAVSRTSGRVPDGLGDLPVVTTVDGRAVAWAAITEVAGHGRTVLAAGLDERLPWDRSYQELVRLAAATVGAALDRCRVVRLERQRARAARAVSETLQRSMLSTPSALPGLEVAVRYVPARHDLRVGGDWYDVFCSPDSAAYVVVGDVAGHDQHAAAAMGQIRNLLRGIAHTRPGGPSEVLGGLDAAMVGLGVGVLASALVVRVEPADGSGSGGRRLSWSSAGHLPPLLVSPDEPARLLWTDADLLLGLSPETTRTERALVLRPGQTLVLFTDGLVERRGPSIEAQLDALAADASAVARLGPDELCGHLLAAVGEAEDDVAMLALRLPPV